MNFSDDVLELNPQLARSKSRSARLPATLKIDDGFKSDLECAIANELTAQGLKWIYEPFAFNLPGGVKYTPDFIITNVSPPIVVEAKGSNRQRGVRDSRSKFRIAAGLFRCFRFVWITTDELGSILWSQMR